MNKVNGWAGSVIKALAAGLMMAATAGTAQAAAQTQLEASFAEVAVGDIFEVVLKGLGFDQNSDGKPIGNVTGGQNLNFTFNSASAQVLGIVIDPRWTFTSGNRTGTINQAVGTLTGVAFGVFPATTDDDFTIATLTLKALAPGQVNLTLASAQFIGQVDGRSGQLITAGLAQASVAVVPEPEQWALLMAGIGVVGWRARRSKGIVKSARG